MIQAMSQDLTEAQRERLDGLLTELMSRARQIATTAVPEAHVEREALSLVMQGLIAQLASPDDALEAVAKQIGCQVALRTNSEQLGSDFLESAAGWMVDGYTAVRDQQDAGRSLQAGTA